MGRTRAGRKERKKRVAKQEKARVIQQRAEKEAYEASCVYCEGWEDLKAYGETDPSPNYRLEIDVERGCGHIWPKDPLGKDFVYLSTHTFYGKSWRGYQSLLRKHGFHVRLRNWDAHQMHLYDY